MTNLKTLSQNDVEVRTASDYEFATELVQRAQDFKPATQAQADKLSALLVEVKTRFKALETERTSATKPLLATKRKIDEWFKPAKAALTEAEKLLKGKMSAYLVEADQAKAKALVCDTTEVPAEASTGKGVSAKRKWTWRVADITKVPEEYLVKVVHTQAVDDAIADRGGQVNIPGIVIEEEFDLRVTARK